MKYLSRAEELILLAVIQLGDNAYCVPIFDKIQEMSGKEWTLGSIYNPLYRLEKNNFLESYMGEPSSERGGKSKRFYKITALGKKALQDIRKLNEISWNNLPDTAL